MTTTSSERRLHPVSVLFESGRLLKGMLLPLIVFIFATRPSGAWYIVLLLALVSATVIVAAIVRYVRFRYRYDERDLVVRSGLFTRNERRIPYVRIQNLDAAQNPLHRLLDVTVVYVQTGGGSEPEAALRVLPLGALEEMRARVLAAGGSAGDAGGAVPAPERIVQPHIHVGEVDDQADARDAAVADRVTRAGQRDTAVADRETQTMQREAPPRRTLLTLSPRDLIVAGFIENRGMVLIVGALALLEQTGIVNRFVEQLVESEASAVSALAARWMGGTEVTAVRGALYLTVVVLTILLFIRLLSTVWAVVRLYDFRLDRIGDDLHTEYGLFTRVSATIPLRRVQTVIVREGPLHRLLGRRMVSVETAGGIIMDNSAPQREPIAPILHLTQLPALLGELQSGLNLDDIEWKPVHPRAFGRILRGSLFWPIALAAAAYLVVDDWAVAVFVVLTASAFVHARLRARYLGWSLTSDSIAARDGALTRTIRIARFNRVQVAAIQRNPLDVRTGMSRVRADTAGAVRGVVIPYLPEHTADALHDELVARTAETEFTW